MGLQVSIFPSNSSGKKVLCIYFSVSLRLNGWTRNGTGDGEKAAKWKAGGSTYWGLQPVGLVYQWAT